MIEWEIKGVGSELGVPPSVVEKDYVISWLLRGIWSSGLWRELAFRGATCLRKVYFPGYRFSQDLDFVLLGGVGRLRGKVERAVEAANAGPVEFLGVDFRWRRGVRRFPGKTVGAEIRVPFRLLSRTGDPPRVRMDVTLVGYERILLPLVERPIIHGYSDAPVFSMVRVMAYDLREILAEKIRSLLERTRPRDLYDVWFLKDRVNLEEVLRILPSKLEAKGVEPDIGGFLGRRRDFEGAWDRSLAHQLVELPKFGVVWAEVSSFLEEALQCLI